MIDIDDFKFYNDVYDHGADDGCLASVSRAMFGVLNRPASRSYRTLRQRGVARE
jgi:PleD family two-component response regulator